MRFEGTRSYVATDDLKVAVNAAITLERDLRADGESGDADLPDESLRRYDRQIDLGTAGPAAHG